MSECGTACANYKELSRPSVFDKNRARDVEVRNFSSCSADAQIINFRDILSAAVLIISKKVETSFCTRLIKFELMERKERMQHLF